MKNLKFLVILSFLAVSCGASNTPIVVSLPAMPDGPPPPPSGACDDYYARMKSSWNQRKRVDLWNKMNHLPISNINLKTFHAINQLDELANKWLESKTDLCKALVVKRAIQKELHSQCSLCHREMLIYQQTLIRYLKKLDSSSSEHISTALSQANSQLSECRKVAVCRMYAEDGQLSNRSAAGIAVEKNIEAKVLLSLGMAGKAKEKALESMNAAVEAKSRRIQTDTQIVISKVASALGEDDIALESAGKALALAQSSYNPVAEADANTVIGLVMCEKKQCKDSILYFQNAEKLYLSNLGENTAKTASFFNHYGRVLAKLGSTTKAIDKFKMVLDIRDSLYGSDYPLLAETYSDIGIALRESGKYVESVDFFKRARDLNTKIWGEGDISVGYNLQDLAIAWDNLGRDKQSLEILKVALKIFKKTLGPNNEEIAKVLLSIGMKKYTSSEYAEALTNFEKALAIIKTLKGVDPYRLTETKSWVDRSREKLE